MENYTDNFSEQEVIDMICQYFNEFEGKIVSANALHGKVVTGKKYLPQQNIITYSVSEKIINENGLAIDHRFSLSDDYLKKILNALLNEKGITVNEISRNNDGITFSGERSNTEDRAL